MSEFNIYTDGGSRGNPGPAALGVVIKNAQGETVDSFKRYLDTQTNNSAEYMALLAACEWLASQPNKAKRVNFFLDSELVVKQLNGQYRIKHPELGVLAGQIKDCLNRLKIDTSVTHIKRALNSEADALVNQALDEVKL